MSFVAVFAIVYHCRCRARANWINLEVALAWNVCGGRGRLLTCSIIRHVLASGKRNLPFDPKLGGTVLQLFVLSLVRNVLELGYSNSLTRQDK